MNPGVAAELPPVRLGAVVGVDAEQPAARTSARVNAAAREAILDDDIRPLCLYCLQSAVS